MNLKDIVSSALPVIEKSAPVLASTIGSPLAGIGTSFAVSLLAHAFNIEPDKLTDLSNAITNDPQACDKLCELEKNFKHIFKHMPAMPSMAEVNIKLTWDKQN